MLFGGPRQNITHIAHREVKVIYITDKKFFVMQELHVTINLRQVNWKCREVGGGNNSSLKVQLGWTGNVPLCTVCEITLKM